MSRREIYVNVSRIERIFHLESLAGSLARSDPEKQWFLFLVKLAGESIIALRNPPATKIFDPVVGKNIFQLWPSSETALGFRQRLMRVLKAYRCAAIIISTF